MEKRVKFEGLVVMVKELYNKYREIINYLIFGVLTTVVSMIVKYALLFTVLDAKVPFQLQVAVWISWICAVTFAFVTNRRFVFKSEAKGFKAIFKETVKFFSARLATLGLESLFSWLIINVMGRNSDKEIVMWTLAIQAIVIITNYFLSKFMVFTGGKKEAKTVS